MKLIILQITYALVLTQTIVKQENDERKQLIEEWEIQMNDFIPDDMLSFELKKGEFEILEQYIKHPTQIRGAYFISMMDKDKIDLKIKDPKGKIIETKYQKKEAVFSLNITNPGIYQFNFSNEQGKGNQIITFALDIKNATYEHIKQSDLDPIQYKLISLYSGINDLMFDTKYQFQKREGEYQSLNGQNYNYLFYTILESILILFLTIWQVYQIKKIIGIDKKFI